MLRLIGPEPLHRQLADGLRSSIRTGGLAAGEPVPSEAELSAIHGVSRGTVRQALAQLRAEGLIAGGRGRRPVVHPGPLAQPFEELVSFSAWARSMGMEPSGRVLAFDLRPASAVVADALDVPAGTPVHQLVRLRLADGVPMLIERTAFAPGVGEAVAGIDLEHGSIYAALAEHGIRFDAARQAIDAVAASRPDAEHLGVGRGAPLLRVRRRSTAADGRPLEWSDDRYRPDRVTLTIDQLANRPGIARRLSQGGR